MSTKYLGDLDDLHFIPSSPFISRQPLTAREEGELKRICALVLAEVPHSDDAGEEPFAYLAGHITKGKKEDKARAEELSIAAAEYIPDATTVHVAHTYSETSSQPATSSKQSGGTVDETNHSTPSTTPAITPGEIQNRFSDTLPRVSSTHHGSSLKHETKLSHPKVYTIANDHAGTLQHKRKPSDRVEPYRFYASRELDIDRRSGRATRRDSEATRKDSISGAVGHTVYHINGGSHRRDSYSQQPSRLSHAELNKKLPGLPKIVNETQSQTQPETIIVVQTPTKPLQMSRLMKTIRRKTRSTAATPVRGLSSDIPHAPKTAPHPRGSYDPRMASTSSMAPTTSPPDPNIAVTQKRRFRLKLLFSRHSRTVQPAQIPVAV